LDRIYSQKFEMRRLSIPSSCEGPTTKRRGAGSGGANPQRDRAGQCGAGRRLSLRRFRVGGAEGEFGEHVISFLFFRQGVTSPRSVQIEAARSLVDLAKDAVWTTAATVLGHRMAIEVRDESGPVLQAKFTFAIERHKQ
jgi:hypothetical protein